MTTCCAHRAHRTPLLKTSTVALQCGVTSETVLAWVKAGELKATRTPGGHYRFNPAEVEALMSRKSDMEAAV